MNGRGDREQGWEGQGSAPRNSREYQFLRVGNRDESGETKGKMVTRNNVKLELNEI